MDVCIDMCKHASGSLENPASFHDVCIVMFTDMCTDMCIDMCIHTSGSVENPAAFHDDRSARANRRS